MIIHGKHIRNIFRTDKNGNIIYCKDGITPKRNNSIKTSEPIYKVKCDKCGKIFYEKSSIFEKRLSLIDKEYCGKCSRKLMCSIAGLKGNYNIDGSLKENLGRFSTERVNNMNDYEYKIFCEQRKKASRDFQNKLKNNEDLRVKHYEKIFKNSKIGYISKGQRELYEYLKEYGFELEKNVCGLNVDVVNEEKKIIFEYYGDYFHANPLFYSDDDFIKINNMTAKEKHIKDRKRNFHLINNGYNVIIIWENQWKNDRCKAFEKIKKNVDDFIIPKYNKTEPKSKWLNNGKCSKVIKSENIKEYMNNGWKIGRLKY